MAVEAPGKLPTPSRFTAKPMLTMSADQSGCSQHHEHATMPPEMAPWKLQLGLAFQAVLC